MPDRCDALPYGAGEDLGTRFNRAMPKMRTSRDGTGFGGAATLWLQSLSGRALAGLPPALERFFIVSTRTLNLWCAEHQEGIGKTRSRSSINLKMADCEFTRAQFDGGQAPHTLQPRADVSVYPAFIGELGCHGASPEKEGVQPCSLSASLLRTVDSRGVMHSRLLRKTNRPGGNRASRRGPSRERTAASSFATQRAGAGTKSAAAISSVVGEHRHAHPVDRKGTNRSQTMRISPIAIALGLLVTGMIAPAMAASELAKMKGTDEYATGPSRHRAQSAKMHKQHQTQNPNSRSGSTSADTDSASQK